ncbi:aldehyde oxidase GLOX [Sorghum bicolor]|uniref:Galactose oxidase-like Early set domain-containing protein n=1 Tax=Sorghum bicolor TaxID=4558 RepID=C5YVI0_SORBI|nr:aldehyde oxidase GLOX [Sorghum bicolor]EES18670.1 hypothetical protein SORBI_3009G230200 [Sorghum bicolor]|eukprot:XP_002440240.1 aldehyde oxidase GLOX [Sorghum bicolor]
MGSPPRSAVIAVAFLLLASSGEAFFDIFNFFHPHSETDYFQNAFEGTPEQTVPTQTEQEERGAAPALATGLTRVPAGGPPSKAAQDTVALPADKGGGAVGSWTIVSENSGVSAMHMVVMRHGKAVMFDTSTTGRSLMRLPQDNCRIDPRAKEEGTMDCWAHSVEFDYNTGGLRPLKILTDTWCSSGALDPDGNLVQTGGYFEGEKVVRTLSPCDTCDWLEQPNSFAEGRWYATQVALPDGRFIMFGGRRAFSYEYVPWPGKSNDKAVRLPFFRETTDDVENNLYPFVNLLPSGNLFLFANDRSVIFDAKSSKIVRELPKLDGGSRNYPGSAMSTLLPLDLRNVTGDPEPVVVICGGAPKKAFRKGENNTFLPALRDCARINLARPDAQWESEDMPVGRVMGDMLILPTGDLLLLSGAAKGCAGWGFGRQPVLTPILYSPRKAEGPRFRALASSTIARMYHSSSAVLPDATVLVAGGNANAAYNFSDVDFPTEVRVERFTPPYLSDDGAADNRAVIDLASLPVDGMRYGAPFAFRFSVTSEPAVVEADVKVTLYAPPFTTHGCSMNQRLLILHFTSYVQEGRSYRVCVDGPGKPELAPRGYYLLFVVAKGVPSVGVWVKVW